MSRKSRRLRRESSYRANNVKGSSNQTWNLSGKDSFFKKCSETDEIAGVIKRSMESLK